MENNFLVFYKYAYVSFFIKNLRKKGNIFPFQSMAIMFLGEIKMSYNLKLSKLAFNFFQDRLNKTPCGVQVVKYVRCKILPSNFSTQGCRPVPVTFQGNSDVRITRKCGQRVPLSASHPAQDTKPVFNLLGPWDECSFVLCGAKIHVMVMLG